MKVYDITQNSTVDGSGVRTIFWLAGCPHHCEGCHNPQTWNYDCEDTPWQDVVMKALESPFNITFSGGEPFEQAYELTKVCHALHQYKNIWVYTGYTWEEIYTSYRRMVLPHIDVLVDGQFKRDLASDLLLFRGSSNQRIIDVQKSLKAREIVPWENDFGKLFVR